MVIKNSPLAKANLNLNLIPIQMTKFLPLEMPVLKNKKATTETKLRANQSVNKAIKDTMILLHKYHGVTSLTTIQTSQ
jgi:hypothetical protein